MPNYRDTSTINLHARRYYGIRYIRIAIESEMLIGYIGVDGAEHRVPLYTNDLERLSVEHIRLMPEDIGKSVPDSRE